MGIWSGLWLPVHREKHTIPRDLKAWPFARFDLVHGLYLEVFVVNDGMKTRGRRTKRHGRRKHDRQLLHRISKPGVKSCASGVGQIVVDGKLVLTLQQRAIHTVLPGLSFHRGSGGFHAT